MEEAAPDRDRLVARVRELERVVETQNGTIRVLLLWQVYRARFSQAEAAIARALYDQIDADRPAEAGTNYATGFNMLADVLEAAIHDPNPPGFHSGT